MHVETLGALFAGALLSGVIPAVNAELLVMGYAVMVAPAAVPLVAAVSTLGQMTSKTFLFALARWSPARLPARAHAAIARAAEKVRSRAGTTRSTIFASAALGFPPFYGVSLVSGALGVRTRTFVGMGTLGRLVRFSVLAWGANQLGVHGVRSFLHATLLGG